MLEQTLYVLEGQCVETLTSTNTTDDVVGIHGEYKWCHVREGSGRHDRRKL